MGPKEGQQWLVGITRSAERFAHVRCVSITPPDLKIRTKKGTVAVPYLASNY